MNRRPSNYNFLLANSSKILKNYVGHAQGLLCTYGDNKWHKSFDRKRVLLHHPPTTPSHCSSRALHNSQYGRKETYLCTLFMKNLNGQALPPWEVLKLSYMYNNIEIILMQEKTFLDVIQVLHRFWIPVRSSVRTNQLERRCRRHFECWSPSKIIKSSYGTCVCLGRMEVVVTEIIYNMVELHDCVYAK